MERDALQKAIAKHITEYAKKHLGDEFDVRVVLYPGGRGSPNEYWS